MRRRSHARSSKKKFRYGGKALTIGSTVLNMRDSDVRKAVKDWLHLKYEEIEDHGRSNMNSMNLSTGAYSTGRPQQSFFRFNGWKIVLPTASAGERERVIFEWPLSKAKAVAV